MIYNMIAKPCAFMLLLLAGTACGSGGTVTAVSTPAPTFTLSSVVVDCGTTAVFGPAALTVNTAYGAGMTLPLSPTCPIGSQVTVTFTSALSSANLGSAPELVFDLLPNASPTVTAVSAGDATAFSANVVVSALPFTTPTNGVATSLYVWLTQLEPQGD
jgi:hypothetical protein